jgi:Holliday junction resolvase RusA-like endonuclease
MTATLIIPGRLPGFNEYSDIQRRNKFAGAKFKRDTQDAIGWLIKQQLQGVHFDTKVRVSFMWVEPNRRRDHDNIESSKKFVLDALVECGVIKGDGWKYVTLGPPIFTVSKCYPRVEVLIMDEL